MRIFSDGPLLACLALAIEALIGYPDCLFRVVGHPVTWMGALIALLDRRFNRASWSFAARRASGVVALLMLLAVVALPSGAFQGLLSGSIGGLAVLALLGASLPAQRSLDTHVRRVADALESEGLEAGRRAVAMIVGRDPATLDRSAVGRAAIESLAENFSDGVVAPALWMAVAGLTGGALYKAVNTADSMIGHRTERHSAFGWAAARFDDLVNLPASRLSAFWIVLAALLLGYDARAAIRSVLRDASLHRSPNAGWPEAAMAGALGLSIGGPRTYAGVRTDVAYMGRGRTDVGVSDIRAALRLYRAACIIQWLLLTILAAAFI